MDSVGNPSHSARQANHHTLMTGHSIAGAINMEKDYPDWTCLECGSKHGKRSPRIATWHYGKCDVCGENNNVTEPRDFGNFPNWFSRKINKKTAHHGRNH
jgi:hypothetical protein